MLWIASNAELMYCAGTNTWNCLWSISISCFWTCLHYSSLFRIFALRQGIISAKEMEAHCTKMTWRSDHWRQVLVGCFRIIGPCPLPEGTAPPYQTWSGPVPRIAEEKGTDPNLDSNVKAARWPLQFDAGPSLFLHWAQVVNDGEAGHDLKIDRHSQS